ncbi:MAG: sugar transferase [Bacteroidales bacterium]|nr:sugar transferase [Bacteroidales bacterium]
MYKSFIKRLLDILLALLAIIVLSPLLIPVMIILLATGEHYVFYGQNRIGYKNRTFKIWKFVTMTKNSPNIGTGSITLRNDPRVLPVGRILRKTKINELPQLINILMGDMSIVGPRPLMKVDFDKFSEDIQSKFYNQPPGLTGIASLIFRDAEKLHSETKMDPHEFDRIFLAPYKGQLELWYQSNLSFLTDIKIIILTASLVVNNDPLTPFRYFKGLPSMPQFE